jgi:hypothetical protein
VTTIASSAPWQPDPSRFENRVLDRMNTAIASGKISAADGQAMAGALGDIAQALSSDGTSASAQQRGALRAQVNGVIEGDVSAGKLTSDQASELKSLLGGGRGHHAHGAHGPSPVPREDGRDPENDGDADDQSAGASSGDSAASSSFDPLASFLKILKDAQQALQTASYGSDGTTATSTSAASLGLVDKTA